MADEAGVLDFAGIDSAAVSDSAVVDTPAVDTDVAAVETDAAAAESGKDSAAAAETNADGTKKETKQQYNSDGTPKEAAADKAEDLPGTEKTPQEIRSLLKAMRDADPKNVAAVKQLHGAFERWEAAEASDAKLYDPAQNAELISDVVEDLKAQGKLDNLGSLTSAMLDATKAHNEKGYYAAFAPHFISGLELVNMPGAINGLVAALADPDPAKGVAAAKTIADGLKKWYGDLEAENKKTKEAVVSPERKQLDADRAAFLQQQEEFKTNQSTEFKNSVAKSCESVNNKLLGAELGPFLKMAFFQGYGKENLMPLGNTIKQNLYDTLKADTAYQAQMKAMWGAKTPDRAKIEEYHKARLASIAKDIVRNTVQKMYPGYAKGGAAAGRVAAAAAKKTVAAKADVAAVASGKPLYVATKPSRDAIDMDHVDSHGKPDAIMEMIAGRAHLKGSGKWVTWRR